MAFSLNFKRRKSSGGSGGSNSQSLVYGLLCLGVLGFFGWVWMHSGTDEKPAIDEVKRSIEAKKGVSVPIRLEQPQYRAVTNALKEFAQVADRIKKIDSTPTSHSAATNLTSPALRDTNLVNNGASLPNGTHLPPAASNFIRQPFVSPKPKEIVTVTGLENRDTAETVLQGQIALARSGIFSGSIDGRIGPQTHLALVAFQKQHHLPPTGLLDSRTKSALLLSSPITTHYTLTTNDFGRLLPLSTTWLGKSEQPRLEYETILELLGEKSFSNPRLIRDLNPGVNWDHVRVGTVVVLPSIELPPITERAAMIKISLGQRILEAFDEETNLLVHFPCSIGHLAIKRPVGELRVETIAKNPNYTFDPAVFPESEAAQSIGKKLILPPGPNNPVGVAWIGLNRPGYGIHGTPVPEQVGKTESHGCFRLANWNAEYLSRLLKVGVPVYVEP